ncbi:ubiquitinyl hydrolase 1 [Sarracenia purpurea var. burkii]
MNSHLTESPEFDSSPLDSVDLTQTPHAFSPNPPTKTLDDILNSSAIPSEINAEDSSNCDYFSPCLDETVDDQPDSALFLDAGSQEGHKDDNASRYPRVNTNPEDSSSHQSPKPCESCRGTSNSALGYPDWASVGDAKPLESSLSESWSLQEQTGIKPLVSGSPAWCREIKPAMVGLQIWAILAFLMRSYNVLHTQCRLFLVFGRAITRRLVMRFQQEDAHEFLQCLLDKLDNCCISSKMKNTTLPLENENLVKQVFGGRLVSKLRCCNCGHCSDTYEPLIDLSLEIENVGTLPSALESFTKVEKIEDPETQFTCEKCKEGVSIEKQLILDQAPSIAAFHLKRFKNDGSFVEKIDKHVEFPLELDLLPYTSGSQNNNVDLKYDLYAVVVHIGSSSTSGHYYSFVRSTQDAWYRLDDSKVARVREDYVLSQEAYILFYAKQGTPWFSSFMETEMSSLDQNTSSNSPKSVLDNTDHISEVKKAGEDVVGISVESFKGCRHDGVDGNVAKDDAHSLFTPVPPGMGNSLNGTSVIVERKFSPSAFMETNCNTEFNEVKNSANVTPSTPPRSPSPDIYADEPPALIYSIPRNHLTSEKRLPCKRQLDKELEDSERQQARKLLKKMPNGRSSKLLAAMNGFHKEGHLNNRKSGRMGASSIRNNNNNKPNFGSFMRPVAAGDFR